MNFGPPTQIQKNGNFGEVWIYGGSTNEDTNFGVKQETNVYINSTGYKDKTATMRIFIDKNNNVYKKEVKHSKKYNYWVNGGTYLGTYILIMNIVFNNIFHLDIFST
jgi:deferrochelatase/peroxidase EfeB